MHNFRHSRPSQLVAVCASAFVLLLSLAVATAPEAAAATASGSIPSWPWTPGSTAGCSGGCTANGAPIGAACTLDFWSTDNTAGTVSETVQWDNTHDAFAGYACDIIGPPNVTMTGGAAVTDSHSPPYCPANPFPMINESVWSSGKSLNAPLYGPPCMGSGTYGAIGEVGQSQSVQLLSGHYNGTTSAWYRVSGEIDSQATCQPGGSGSSTYCNGSPGGVSWTAPSLVSGTMCASAPGSSVLNIFMATGSTNDVNALCTTVTAASQGYGAPTNAPARPDGSGPANTTGTCHVGTVTVTVPSGDVTATNGPATTNSAFAMLSGDTVTATSSMTWSGGNSPGAWMHVRSTDGSVDDTVALTVGASSPSSLTGSFTATKNTFYRLAVGCSMGAVDLNQQNYDGTTETNTVPGGGPIDTCLINCGSTQPGTGPALACFNGFFTRLNLFGFDVFPWVNITQGPSDVLCFAQAITVGTAGDWQAQFATMRSDFSASPLGDYVNWMQVPFNAWGTFTASYSAGSAGCAGPTMNMPLIDTVGFHTHTTAINPFSTCDSNIATGATLVRDAFTIGLWIGFCWFAIGVLSAAFAFSPLRGQGPES